MTTLATDDRPLAPSAITKDSGEHLSLAAEKVMNLAVSAA